MKKIRRTMAGRAKGFVQDWSLPRQLAGEDGMQRGGEEHDLEDAAAAAGGGGHGRHQHLPVLRGRLRPARLREERQAASTSRAIRAAR